MKTTPFTTFREPSNYLTEQLKQEEPSCFNGIVRIRKFKITIEEIEEPKEVLVERLRKLWRESDNMHHWKPLKNEAEKLGINLNLDERDIPHA
jgi:hypothetical protein